MDREQARDTVKNYLEDYLRSKGINTRAPFRCLNPDHEDKHPSMSYDRNRHRCKCFSCGESYDIFDLIGMDYGLTDAGEIFSKAYSLYGITVDDNRPADKPKPAKPVKKEAAPVQAADYTEKFNALAANISDPAAQEYLQKRGISEEVARKYWLGYDAQYETFNVNEEGQNTFAIWQALIIPTGKGSLIARNIGTPKEPQKKNRYRKVGPVNFFNCKALYSDFKYYYVAGKPIFVVEGEIDALSIIEVGGQAVGLGSTANVKRFITLLEKKKPSEPLILALDSDEDGQRAEDTLAEELTRLKISFYRHNPYGEAKDANEALQKDRAAFQADVAAAEREVLAEEPAGQLQPVGNYIDDFKQHRLEQKQNIRTGFKTLDIALGGGLGNELYVMGAETGTGKSAIASILAQNIARAGVDVIYYALEMGRDEFIARGASAISAEDGGISEGTAIKYGEMLNDTYDTLTGGFYLRPYAQYEKHIQEYVNRYGKHLYIVEGGTEGTTARDIKDTVTQFKQSRGLTQLAVFVDYLQLLSADQDDKTQRDFMTRMSTAIKVLKTLASQVGAAVFVISSMANDRKGQRVNDASFKYSGDIGYTGGVLLGWNWKGVTDTTSEDTRAETIQRARDEGFREMVLEVLKQRSGDMSNQTRLHYYPAYNYMVDAADFAQVAEEPADVFKGLRGKAK